MIPLKKKAMQVTDSIKMRIIFLILPVLCLLGEVHRNERKNNHAIYVENISKVAKALRSTSDITKLYECPQCTNPRAIPAICSFFWSSAVTKRFDFFTFSELF